MSAIADRQIVIRRILNAPRELVYQAWTDPKHLGEWWGPRGFKSDGVEMDVRVGGVWRLTMTGPDGTVWPNRMEFLEVVPNERLVYDHGDDANPQMFHVVVTFAERGAQTELTMTSTFPTAEARDFVVREVKAIESGKQTVDRLEEYLANDADQDFVLTRVFAAPRALVWKAWTEGDRLAQWWGPKGFEMTTVKLDLRPGGVFHYGMRGGGSGPMGGQMWGRFVFREIVAPDRLAFVTSFSDADGGITRHPMSATWPLEVFNVLTLAERDGRTTLTLRGRPINASEEELVTFAGGKASMRGGFAGTWSQLDAYLASIQT